MSMHDCDVTARLSRFLDRKKVSSHLVGKQMAQDDEMRALIAKVSGFAPRSPDSLAAWWPLFEDTLSEACGDFWPSEKLIKPAATAASKAAPRPQGPIGDGRDMREVAIIGRAMANGLPVGESWLWGRGAVELIAERLVDEATMTSYRKAAFWNRAGGKHPTEQARQDALTAARAWEAEAKDRHEAAKKVWRTQGEPAEQRNTSIPNKSAPYDNHAFAAE